MRSVLLGPDVDEYAVEIYYDKINKKASGRDKTRGWQLLYRHSYID